MAAASGRLDIETWRAFKRSKDKAEQRRLLDQLVRDNEPLRIVLTAQLCGRGENRPGRRQKFQREPYVETLSLEEQEACGQIGMMKALRDFNPKKRDDIRAEHGLAAAANPAAGLPAFAVWKIKYELQAAIEKAGCITLRRGVAPQDRPGVARMDDPEFVESALEESANYLGGSGESLRARLAREEAEDVAPQLPRPKSAIEDFITRRCDFQWTLFTSREKLLCTYERHARFSGFAVTSPVALERALFEAAESKKRRLKLQNGTLPGTHRRGQYFRGVGVATIFELGRRIDVLESQSESD